MQKIRILLFIAISFIFILSNNTKVSARTWDPYDHKLIYNEAEWGSFNNNAKFNYICSFIDDINDLLGLTGLERVTKEQVHQVTADMPEYYDKRIAYTTKDKSIYINMDKTYMSGEGAGYGLIILAHEMKHVEQILHGRVNWSTAALIDYSNENFFEELYSNQPHEREASEFGLGFTNYLKTHWDQMRGSGIIFDDN